MATMYKVLEADGSCAHGGSGTWSLPTDDGPGERMRSVEGDIGLCENGYHLCPVEGLREWAAQGCVLYEAEGSGDCQESSSKTAYRRARLVRRVGIISETAIAAAGAEYNRVVDPAGAEYRRVVDSAGAEYRRVVDSARAEYRRVVDSAFGEVLLATIEAETEALKGATT